MSNFLTRKEIAAANEVSPETIRRCEHALGLDRCRDRSCERPIRYDRTRATRQLRRRGLRIPN